jgi:hypothetical protein
MFQCNFIKKNGLSDRIGWQAGLLTTVVEN